MIVSCVGTQQKSHAEDGHCSCLLYLLCACIRKLGEQCGTLQMLALLKWNPTGSHCSCSTLCEGGGFEWGMCPGEHGGTRPLCLYGNGGRDGGCIPSQPASLRRRSLPCHTSRTTARQDHRPFPWKTGMALHSFTSFVLFWQQSSKSNYCCFSLLPPWLKQHQALLPCEGALDCAAAKEANSGIWIRSQPPIS